MVPNQRAGKEQEQKEQEQKGARAEGAKAKKKVTMEMIVCFCQLFSCRVSRSGVRRV